MLKLKQMKLKYFILTILFPIFSFSQNVKITSSSLWEDFGASDQKLISGYLKIDSLLIDQYHKIRVSESTAYYLDGSISNLEMAFGFDIDNNGNQPLLSFFSPKTNTKVIDSIVGKIDYYSPTILNNSILKTKYPKELLNKDLVKNKYPIKIILLDIKEILKIKNDNIENQTLFFQDLILKNNLLVPDLNDFVKHFYDDFPIMENNQNDFLFLISDLNYTKFNGIKLIDSENNIMRTCTEIHYSKKKCTWWYFNICKSEKVDSSNFEIALFFENEKDIKTYNFKIENITIQPLD